MLDKHPITELHYQSGRFNINKEKVKPQKEAEDFVQVVTLNPQSLANPGSEAVAQLSSS